MNNISNKRKNNDDNLDIIQLSKRFKSEITIQKHIENQNETDLSRNSIPKLQNKLLTATPLKQRYKYHCKKHNVLYLVENARKKVKESSKQNRNDIIQNFRSLHESTNIAKETLRTDDAKVEDQLDSRNVDTGCIIKDCFVKPQLVTYRGLKRKLNVAAFNDEDNECQNDVKDSNIKTNKIIKRCLSDHKSDYVNDIAKDNFKVGSTALDTDEESECFEDYAQKFLARLNILKSNVKKGSKMNSVVIDDSEDSDYGEDFDKMPYPNWKSQAFNSKNFTNRAPFDEGEESDCTKEANKCKRGKNRNCYIVKKFLGENSVSFSEADEYSQSATDYEDTDCDCFEHEKFLNDTNSIFEYDSSIDNGFEDYGEIYYTG